MKRFLRGFGYLLAAIGAVIVISSAFLSDGNREAALAIGAAFGIGGGIVILFHTNWSQDARKAPHPKA